MHLIRMPLIKQYAGLNEVFVGLSKAWCCRMAVGVLNCIAQDVLS